MSSNAESQTPGTVLQPSRTLKPYWRTWTMRWIYVCFVGSLLTVSTRFFAPFCHLVNRAGDILSQSPYHGQNNSTLESLAVALSMPCYFEIPGNLCLDADTGVRLMVDHVQHLTNIMTIVEGVGRPVDDFFSNVMERHVQLNEIYESGFLAKNEGAFIEAVLYFLPKMLELGQTLRGVSGLPMELGGASGALGRQLWPIFHTLNSIQSQHDNLHRSSFHRRLSMSQADRLVNPLMRNLIGNSSLYYEGVALPEIDASLAVAKAASFQAAQILVDLDKELVRLDKAIGNLTWWDHWAVGVWDRWAPNSAHRFGPLGLTWRMFGYREALTKLEHSIRTSAEDVLIAYNNLILLKDYVSWHKQYVAEAIKYPRHHVVLSTDTPSLSQTIDLFREQMRRFTLAGRHPDIPARPPRRIPSTIFSIVKDIL